MLAKMSEFHITNLANVKSLLVSLTSSQPNMTTVLNLATLSPQAKIYCMHAAFLEHGSPSLWKCTKLRIPVTRMPEMRMTRQEPLWPGDIRAANAIRSALSDISKAARKDPRPLVYEYSIPGSGPYATRAPLNKGPRPQVQTLRFTCPESWKRVKKHRKFYNFCIKQFNSKSVALFKEKQRAIEALGELDD